MRRAHVVALAILVVISAVTGVALASRWDPGPEAPAPGEQTSAPTPQETQATATPVPAPEVGACERLDYDEAVAPTTRTRAVPCSQPHTAQVYEVGRLDLVSGGHLLAVDSAAAQDQAADTCADAVAGHVGAAPETLRLSMVETVWFTPTVQQATRGADWLRCDVVAVSGGERLVALPDQSRGMLASEPGRSDYAMCGTAQPAAKDFRRVVCSAPHSWRAVASVDLPGEQFPSAKEAGAAMEDRCGDVARERADDPLDFTWAEERPSRQQWRAGRHYGLCWVPD